MNVALKPEAASLTDKAPLYTAGSATVPGSLAVLDSRSYLQDVLQDIIRVLEIHRRQSSKRSTV
jgi:hypothetical protein